MEFGELFPTNKWVDRKKAWGLGGGRVPTAQARTVRFSIYLLALPV